MSLVLWSEAAKDDLADLRDFYAEVSDETAQMIIDRVVLATRWLLDWPFAGREVGGDGWRKWSPRRTGQVLIYRPVDSGIEISRVRGERENWMADL